MRRHVLAATAVMTALTIPFVASTASAQSPPTSSSEAARETTRGPSVAEAACTMDVSGNDQNQIWQARVDVTHLMLAQDRSVSAELPRASALSGTNISYNDNGVEFYQRFFVHAGSLYFDRTKYVADTNKLVSRYWQLSSGGFSAKKRLVNVADDSFYNSMHGYMYALAPKYDRIYRYKVTKARGATPPAVAHAGRKDGFTSLKSLTLAGRSGSKTFLLGTTTSGKLRQITIPDSSTFKLSIRTIRNKGWKNYDYLAVDDRCGGAKRLLAVNPDTSRVKILKLTSSGGKLAVSYQGRLQDDWPYRLTAPLTDQGDYPSFG